MDFDFIIQCGECPFFSYCCDYPYRKLIEFLYVRDGPFRKMIVLLSTCWHCHPILWDLLGMLQYCNYPIPENLVEFHYVYHIKRNLPTFVSNQYTGLYVHEYPFQKLIVLLYTCWHGHPILGDFLAMLQSCNYPIPGKLVNIHCGCLVKRNWPTFVSTRYTGLLNRWWL